MVGIVKVPEAGASALDHVASGQARIMNAMTEAHIFHAKHEARGIEAGMESQSPVIPGEPQAARPGTQSIRRRRAPLLGPG